MFVLATFITAAIAVVGLLVHGARRRARLVAVRSALAASVVFATVAAFAALGGQGAGAIATPVPLGTAGDYAVLGGQSVTNTGPSVITGNVGVAPGSSITGFPPGIVTGTFHAADAESLQAQTDLIVAYDDAAGQAPDATIAGGQLGGLNLVPGVYTDDGIDPLALTGTLTLDAGGDPDAVFVFQSTSSLITASASSVSFINEAQPCNVYWLVPSSATIGTGSSFVGTILALTSISMNTGATLNGRVLARNGSVTLDTNVITRSDCAVIPPETTTTVGAETTTIPGEATTVPGEATTIPGEATTIPGEATTVVGEATTTAVGVVPPAPGSNATGVPPVTGALGSAPTGITLPQTGGETGQAAALATALLVFGAVVALVARRKVSAHR